MAMMNIENMTIKDYNYTTRKVYVMTNNKKIGEAIKNLRENIGYSQQNIAAFLQVDQSLVSKIEKGERNISADMLEKLACLFGVTKDSILNNSAVIKPLIFAFRGSGLTADEMEIIRAINKIALNLEFMNKLLEEKNV